MASKVKATVEQYSALCDVVERAWQRWPVESYRDDVCNHTSDYARAAAFRIATILGLEVEEPWADLSPRERARLHRGLAAYIERNAETRSRPS
jgi:hypothetical protein